MHKYSSYIHSLLICLHCNTSTNLLLLHCNHILCQKCLGSADQKFYKCLVCSSVSSNVSTINDLLLSPYEILEPSILKLSIIMSNSIYKVKYLEEQNNHMKELIGKMKSKIEKYKLREKEAEENQNSENKKTERMSTMEIKDVEIKREESYNKRSLKENNITLDSHKRMKRIEENKRFRENLNDKHKKDGLYKNKNLDEKNKISNISRIAKKLHSLEKDPRKIRTERKKINLEETLRKETEEEHVRSITKSIESILKGSDRIKESKFYKTDKSNSLYSKYNPERSNHNEISQRNSPRGLFKPNFINILSRTKEDLLNEEKKTSLSRSLARSMKNSEQRLSIPVRRNTIIKKRKTKK